MKKILFVVIFSILVIMAFAFSVQSHKSPEIKEPLTEKISQMIVIGYNGEQDYKALIESIKKDEISGVIFYKRNIKSREKIRKIITTLNSHNKGENPLFMMLDQEGGQVSRINKDNGFKYYPEAEVVGKKYSLNDANELYSDMAKSLKEVGFNFNLAPCVDIKSTPNSSIGLNKRSYANNAYTVSKYAKEFIKAHNSNKVITALKHYPGIGSAVVDSHKTMPDITSTWTKEDILPFRDILKEFPNEPIMSAHVLNKNWDSENVSSMSKKWLSYLSEQLNHNGIVLMDATDMDAINNYSIEDIIIKGINSGVNLFMFPNHNKSDNLKLYMNPEKFNSIVLDAVKTGKISEEKINLSYEKIIKLKEEYIK